MSSIRRGSSTERPAARRPGGGARRLLVDDGALSPWTAASSCVSVDERLDGLSPRDWVDPIPSQLRSDTEVTIRPLQTAAHFRDGRLALAAAGRPGLANRARDALRWSIGRAEERATDRATVAGTASGC